MIAIILSIIFPGLGQIYYGKTFRGILMILLCFVPFAYPIILVWSIWDCVRLRKTQQVDPITRREAITAIVIFFVVVPLGGALLILGGLKSVEYISDNYTKPKQTREEMAEIAAAYTRLTANSGNPPQSLQDLVGWRPLRQTWFQDAWDTPYHFDRSGVLKSAGIDRQFGTGDDLELKLGRH